MSTRLDAALDVARRLLIEPLGHLGALLVAAVTTFFTVLYRLRKRLALAAERLADRASTNPSNLTGVAPHLEVVQQFGIHMRTFERNGRMQVCYDGDLFRQVLSMPNASAEERAHAALALTRPDCIDPDLGPLPRAALDDERSNLPDTLNEQNLNPVTRSRLRARRAGVWASITFFCNPASPPGYDGRWAQRRQGGGLTLHARSLMGPARDLKQVAIRSAVSTGWLPPRL